MSFGGYFSMSCNSQNTASSVSCLCVSTFFSTGTARHVLPPDDQDWHSPILAMIDIKVSPTETGDY